jgi:hypothetical protein
VGSGFSMVLPSHSGPNVSSIITHTAPGRIVALPTKAGDIL